MTIPVVGESHSVYRSAAQLEDPVEGFDRSPRITQLMD
jgi:hypothetical protein